MQAAAFALFSGKIDEAKKRLYITQPRRIAGQFDIEGRQMAELERTRPWHYSNFNLEAYNRLGRLGEKAGVDIWNFTLDGHSLRKGYQYIASFIDSDTPWPGKTSIKWTTRKRAQYRHRRARGRKMRCSVTKRSGAGEISRRYHYAHRPAFRIIRGQG